MCIRVRSMSGWAGFSDAELRRMKGEDNLNKKCDVSPPNKTSGTHRNDKKVPNILSTSSKGKAQKNSCLSPTGNNEQFQKELMIVRHDSTKDEPNSVVIKEEIDEINDQEALSRDMQNLDKFRDQQKMIEEANKQRKALLSKTLSERQRKAREEAQKLAHIQKELQLLDNRLSADVTMIRSRIELASKDYMDAQKRYDKAEREFIDAKMDLQKKSEIKEQLTEHLYTIIHQNELRKSEKLSQLMTELHVEMDAQDEGIHLTTLPPLSSFSAMNSPQTLSAPKPLSNHSSIQNTSQAKDSGSIRPEDISSKADSSNIPKPESTKKKATESQTAKVSENENIADKSSISLESIPDDVSSTRSEHIISQTSTLAQSDNPPNNDKTPEENVLTDEQNRTTDEQSVTRNEQNVTRETSKQVPSSWTLDVINIKKEPEDS